MQSQQHSDASKVLEAALENLDSFISVRPAVGAPLTLSERNLISCNNVLSTAKTLALALQQVGIAAPAPDPVTAARISDWLDTHIPRQDLDDRLSRLQRDKESLAIQYQMLAERVSKQADKIIELEGLLTEKTKLLCVKEEQLQRQMISSSALETQKLELMSALSELKLHRAALERENVELQLDAVNSVVEKGVHFGSIGNLNHRNFVNNNSKTPPISVRHQIQPQFYSLPRVHSDQSKATGKNSITNNNNNRVVDANVNNGKQRNVVFASKENILIEDNQINEGNDMQNSIISQTHLTQSPTLRERSSKGFRNIFSKLRRSNSSSLELSALEQSESEFRRGGARATAGGRLEWPSQFVRLSNSKDYKDWTPQEVCNWLIDLGLGCYEDSCRKWLKANPNVCFFSVSAVDIEKELNLKSPLHRKKIILAIDQIIGKETDNLALKAALLDTNWVMRWLDDIGLPQYKDHFLQAKVDGSMLHRLTLEDLSQLHVSSCLHIASLRCGIQCMRENNWNSECLIRRSTNNTQIMDKENNDKVEIKDSKPASNDSKYIALWTAHRVMEWLRVADLSEYAPNLRGAGVHGSLMLYEPRFNADLLAELLSIPPSKSLLRRHLATHFKELLGRDVIQMKRKVESELGYQPLTITSKLKPSKKAQFSLKRRKSSKTQSDIEWTDYVCPMSSNSRRSSSTNRDILINNNCCSST